MATIPVFYRVYFTYFDPLVSGITTVMSFYDAESMLSMLIPEKYLPFNENIKPLVWQMGALFGMVAILTSVLLRYTNDLGVWKILQGSIAVVDFAILLIMYWMLDIQNRLDIAAWTPNDWANLAVTGLCAIVRCAFVAGVGLAPATHAKKE